MIHIWHWILDFTGVNYQQDSFATHMYNFWSGFGGDIAEFALIGTIITLYRSHIKNISIKEIVAKDIVQKIDKRRR